MNDKMVFNLRIISNVIITSALVILSISTAVVFVLNFVPIYLFAVNIFDIAESSGYSHSEIMENYYVLIEYNSIFGKDVLEFPTFEMSKYGRIHFEEVKEIFVLFQYLIIILFPITVLLIIYKMKKREVEFLKCSSIITIGTPILVGVFVLISWEWAFTMFHEIVFNNDYWIFDYRTDPVIKVLPEEYFLLCAICIIAIIATLSLIMFLFYRHFKLRIRD